jgi:transcription termination factor NusB
MALFGRKKEEPVQGMESGGLPPLPPDQQQYQEQPMQQDPYSQQGYDQQQPAMMPPMPPPQGAPIQDPYAQQPMPQQMPMPEPPAMDKEKIEEVAEAIIDEKWNELLKDINKMIEWKEKTDSRLIRIEQDITNLKSNFESLQKGIVGKISDYDKNLVEVGTEIKAMEKVFQKVLPTFTENINKLSRLTNNVSKKR